MSLPTIMLLTFLGPGHGLRVPGNGNAYGLSGDSPGKSGDAPGLSGDTPGKSGDAPGSGDGVQNTEMQAIGDPHVTNILGQSFDINSEGEVELLRFPQGSDSAKIIITATITKLGKSCHDSYMKQVKLSGSWLQGEVVFKDDEDTGEVLIASLAAASIPVQWTRMNGSKDLRIRYETPKKVHFRLDDENIDVYISTAGRMHQGVGTYLNLALDGFRKLEGTVGGLLGVDDHSHETALGKLRCPKNATKDTARALHVTNLAITSHDGSVMSIK